MQARQFIISILMTKQQSKYLLRVMRMKMKKNEAFNIQIKYKFKIEERIYERFIMKFLFSTKIKQTTLKCVSKK